MFQRLLICTDFNDGNHRLINFVSDLAATGIKQITFLHVVPFDGGIAIPAPDQKKIEQARKLLQPALDNTNDQVEVFVDVESGNKPCDTIAQAAQKYKSDLIILGTPIRNLLTEKLFGSTAMSVFQKVAVPIMVLRPQLISTYTSEELALRCQHLFRCLLIPFDNSDVSRSFIEQIKERVTNSVSKPLKRLHLCWVVDADRAVPVEVRAKEAFQILDQIRDDLASLEVEVDPAEVRQGDPLTEILSAAQMADVSAIVTSSGDLTKKIPLPGPSFAAELLRRSWHPVILFPLK